MKRNNTITPLILCGGEGKRLRPLSTPERPKPFLKLFQGKSLFQLTALRFSASSFAAPIISCHRQHVALVKEQLDEIGIKPLYILSEPALRNTGPAIMATSLFLNRQKQETTLLALPADHWIEDPEALLKVIKRAENISGNGGMVLFGVPPQGPEKDFGYIAYDNEDKGGYYPVQQFIEKPARKVAEALLRTRNIYWNSGIFLFKTHLWEARMRSLCPVLCGILEEALAEATRQEKVITFSAAYKECESIPFDKAVIEYSQKNIVFPLTAYWNDVGKWENLTEVLGRLPSDVFNADTQHLKACLLQRA